MAIERQPDPTDQDKEALDAIVKAHLGEQATGSFIGAMARGVIGDAPHYGHAVVISDPNFGGQTGNMYEYYEKLYEAQHEINSTIHVAGNVTVDITQL